MTPTLPLAAGTPNGTAQPAGSPTAPSTAAPTDFLSLLAQIVGQPAQQAMTPLVATNAGVAMSGHEPEDELLDADAASALGLLPGSLPVFAAEARFHGMGSNAASPYVLPGAQVLGVKAGSLDVQMLTEMIQSEQASAREGADTLESFHLPTASVEATHASKTAVATDQVSRFVHAPVGSAQWADEIGSRLTLMTEQGRSAASLRLSPEHLGPLEIRIAIRDDQASVWFGAAHADTRAAIEHALPRLRELFEAQGLSLADAGVFHEAPREQAHATPSSLASSELGAGSMDETAQTVRVTVGLVDAYA